MNVGQKSFSTAPAFKEYQPPESPPAQNGSAVKTSPRGSNNGDRGVQPVSAKAAERPERPEKHRKRKPKKAEELTFKRDVAVGISEEDRELIKYQKKLNYRTQLWLRFDIFTGLIVISNGAIIAAELYFPDFEYWEVFEKAFAVIFIVEWLYRVAMGCMVDPPQVLIRDVWLLFDFFIITVSTASLAIGTDAGPASLIRILRLFRMARLVRLIRLFKELAMLVKALTMVGRILLWMMVILLVFLVTGGCFGPSFLDAEAMPEICCGDAYGRPFANVPSSMSYLLMVTTWNRWGSILRAIWEQKPYILPFYLGFVIVTPLALMKAVMGVMCQAAIQLQMDDIKQAEERVLFGEQLAEFGLRLHSYAGRPHLAGDTYITREEIMEVYGGKHCRLCRKPKAEDAFYCGVCGKRKPPIPDENERPHAMASTKVLLEGIGIYGNTLFAVLNALDHIEEPAIVAQGLIHIDGLIEAIHWRHPKLLPEDIIFLSTTSKTAEKLSEHITDNVHVMRSVIIDVIGCLNRRVETIFGVIDPTRSSYATTLSAPRHHLMGGSWSSDHLASKTMAAETADQEPDPDVVADQILSMWVPFDMFFGLFVLANGVSIGIQTNNEMTGEDTAHFATVNTFFLYAFISELVLRLFAMSATMHGSHLYFVFPWPPPLPPQVLICAREKFFYDGWVWFDVFCISISFLDNVIILLIGMDGQQGDLHILTTLRLMRFLRLTRLVRIMKLFPALKLLVTATLSSGKLILWVSVTIGIGLYICAIILREVIKNNTDLLNGPDEEVNAEMDRLFGKIPYTMLTLMSIATADTWPELVRHFNYRGYYAVSVMIFFFLAVFGLGVLNLVLGVMCTAAQDAVLATERNRLEKAFRGVMLKSVEIQDGMKKVAGGSHFINKETFTKFREDIAHACEMTEDEVENVFNRLSVEGELDTRSFIQGCLANRVPISNVDLLQVTIATRELRDKLSEVGKELDGLQYVFKETCKKIALVNISQTPRSLLPRQLDPHGNMAQTALQQAKRWHSTGKDHESRGVLKGLELSKVTDLPSETREIDYTKVSPRAVLTPRSLGSVTTVMPEQAAEVVDWDVTSQGLLHRRLEEEQAINQYLKKMVTELERQNGMEHEVYVPPKYGSDESDYSDESPAQSPRDPKSSPRTPRSERKKRGERLEHALDMAEQRESTGTRYHKPKPKLDHRDTHVLETPGVIYR
jgi:hypothetical protein